MITTIFVLGFITNSQLNSLFMVDAQDGSNNGQSENTESVLRDIGLDNSANSTMSNFSLPTVSSSEDSVSDKSNFTLNNTAEQPAIPNENATPPEENTTVPQEPSITDENAPEENITVSENVITSEPPANAAENVTTSEPPTKAAENVTTSEPPTNAAENVTTSEPPTNINNNISASNITTTSAAPVEGVDIINSESNSSADQALPAEQQSANNITSANITATTVATETNADTLDQTTSPEDTLGAQASNQTESARISSGGSVYQ